ncbi:MAG: isoprenyl transferase [Clostridia bacterium]|nr:isoprenyl transferase [Clostridia bacterium]
MAENSSLPRHVAIIMDGNRRWAKKHMVQIAMGHRKGVDTLRSIIRESSDLGIEALTLYAFSTENWRRAPSEVEALMGLLLEYFTSEIDELCRERVCIRILGVKEGLPEKQRQALIQAEARTKDNDGLKLSIAINYGGRDEIVRCVRKIAAEAAEGTLSPEAVDERLLESRLDTQGLPDVDLLIRTSGEMRLSNFLLYQVAYAEFVFSDVLWPDFDLEEYHKALAEYARRGRRFGGG